MSIFQQQTQFQQCSPMVSKLKKPSIIDEAIQTISNDLTYLDNKTGQIKLTQDAKSWEAIRHFKNIYDFLEKIGKCAGCPTHIFEKNLDATTLTSVSKLAQPFYQFMFTRGELPVLKHYELSPATQALNQIAQELRIFEVGWRGNALGLISASGLLEGELIDSFVSRLKDALLAKGYREQVATRKAHACANFTGFQRHFKRHQVNFPNLYIARVELSYSTSLAPKITLQESTRHVELFTSTLPELWNPVGWWWKREFLSETSYIYNFIFYVDLNSTPYVANCEQAIGEHWQEVTENAGSWVAPFDLQNHKTWGTNFWGYSSAKQQGDALLASVKMMCQRDVYLRLRPVDGFPHVGMSALPKLAVCTARSIPIAPPQPQYRPCQR